MQFCVCLQLLPVLQLQLCFWWYSVLSMAKLSWPKAHSSWTTCSKLLQQPGQNKPQTHNSAIHPPSLNYYYYFIATFFIHSNMPDFCAVHRHHFIIIQHCPCLLFIPHYVIFVKCLRAATGGSGDWRWHSSCRTGGIFQWWFLHLWWAGNSGGDSAIFVDRIVESWKIWNLYSLKTTVHTHCTAYDGSASLL